MIYPFQKNPFKNTITPNEKSQRSFRNDKLLTNRNSLIGYSSLKTRNFIAVKTSLLLTLTILILCNSISAQDNIMFSNKIFPNSFTRQSEMLKQIIPEINNPNITVRLRHFNKSNFSKHYTYDVLYDQLPVFTNFIKVSTNTKNNILSIAKGLGNYTTLSIASLTKERNFWNHQKLIKDIWPAGKIVKNKYLAIYQVGSTSKVVQVQEAWSKTYDNTKLIDPAGNLLAEWNHQRRFGIDTFINANVFDPDPLTVLSKIYGTPYVDSNDQDLSWMSAAYIPVNIPAVYDTFVNKFFIESQYVKIEDFEAPNTTPSNSITNDFYFNRSENGFEECMVAYHINLFHNHLTTLGYDALMDLQLEADAHGQFGADNSVFNRNGGAPTIVFGDGGIDDAEDADVIIHEYSHGVSWSANANTFFGTERPALDEGIADYFATSYSRSLSPFNWQKVFNWDGNNGPWQGRTATTSANYSSPFSGNLYALGEVWNAAMQKIYTDLGRTVTDELMLETLFYLTDSSTLPDAARFMILADDVINGGANYVTLCHNFSSKSILAWNCFPLNTSNIKAAQNQVRVINSSDFNMGIGNVTFKLTSKTSGSLHLYDIKGRLLKKQQFKNDSIELSPYNYSSGIYLAKIITPSGTQTVKLSRN